MNNLIYLRRRGQVFIPKGNQELPINYISAMLKNIESLGYAFSAELIERLQTLSVEEVTLLYNELVEGLKELVGAHRKFKPMYPNFPKQVMEMSESRLYINAWIHYLTNQLPNYVKEPRLVLQDKVELKIIELGTKEEFDRIFTQIVSSNTSISERDKNDISWYVSYYKENVFSLIPAEVPNKENVAYLGAELIELEGATEFFPKYFKTATDVLRLTCAICKGDVSLAEATKFIKLNRPQRKFLLGLLEHCGNLVVDMLRWKKRWIRLGERLHPGEFKNKFPRSFEAFDVLRNNKPFQTFNSKIESALLSKNTAQIVDLLKPRAGDFARRLDHLLRLSEADSPLVLETFAEIARQVSTPVLLQVMTHFQQRNSPNDLRVFFPKGQVGKAQAVQNTLPPFSFAVPKAITAICQETLNERFAGFKPLGKCFLDERLKNYLVPFSQRSASKALKTIVRGSKIPLPEAKVLRFFIWWKNGKYRTDIDLSAAMFDGNYNYADVLSYYNLKGFGGCHSGDIVDAPKGAAEFIDVELQKLIENKVRFVVMSINSYTAQPFCDLPECFAGWMARTQADSGEIFEPKTVQNKIDVASDTKICLPLVIDLFENQVIWTDIALKSYPSWNNVANNLSGVSLMLRAMTNLRKTTLYDLFLLHIKARGELVLDKNQADQIFAVEEGVTPFQLEDCQRVYEVMQINFTEDFPITELDHESWKHSDETIVEKYWSGEVAPVGRHFKACLLWSETAIYVRFEANQNEPLIISQTPDLTGKTLGLWDRDVCEIFLTPNPDEFRQYFEFEVAPTGEWIDLKVHQKTDERLVDWDYDSGIQTAARIEKDKVWMACKVGWRAFGKAPKSGDIWKGNLLRCVGTGESRGYLTWSPTETETPNFHVPEKFGEFEFVSSDG